MMWLVRIFKCLIHKKKSSLRYSELGWSASLQAICDELLCLFILRWKQSITTYGSMQYYNPVDHNINFTSLGTLNVILDILSGPLVRHLLLVTTLTLFWY
jgi:hypothetical protein